MALHPIDPIYLWAGYTSKGIVDLEGAARFLDDQWPDELRTGTSYRRAVKACAAARATGVVAKAREAVLVAARDAHLLDEKAMARDIPEPSPPKRSRWAKVPLARDR